MAEMDIGAIVAAAVAEALAAQAATQEAAPAKATASKAKATPKVVKRNLDPEFVPLDSDTNLAVRISASGWQGSIFKSGARFTPYVLDAKRKDGGTALKSLTLPVMALMVEHADAIAAAVEKVERRAQIGAYLVEPEVTA